MNPGAPIIQPRDIRNEPLAFAQPSVMSHQLPADRNVRGEELKLCDLLEGPVPTIEKHKINLKCWLFGKPSGNDLLRKTKQRRETIYYLRRFGFEVSQHPVVYAVVGLNAPKVAFPVFFQRPQDVQRAAAPQPCAYLQYGPGSHTSTNNSFSENFPFLGIELSFDQALL